MSESKVRSARRAVTPRRALFGCLIGLGLWGCAAAPCRAASLEDFLKSPDPEYKWEKVSDTKTGALRVVELKLTSQRWKDGLWEHVLQICIPDKLTHPGTAGLFITGGDQGSRPSPLESLLAATLASRTEAPFATLYNVPNQPLYGGKKEDDLIAHTFQQFLETGDGSWPLLLPMVKSARRAMDALQEFSKQSLPAPIEKFVVAGASKRGWTTYLTAASGDPRVAGMAPMVFDNLNFGAQMPRQLELWGKYSEQIEDYTRRGLQQKMDTPRGRELTALVDPFSYRSRLTLPKLLVHGANDRYWATDATRLYWEDLPGPKYLLMTPNSGHGLDDRSRVLNSVVAFFQAAATRKPLPVLKVKQEARGGMIRVSVTSDAAPKQVRIWSAQAENFDFRPVKWVSKDAENSDRGWVAELPAPATGGLALFAEAEFTGSAGSFTLSSPSTVHGKKAP